VREARRVAETDSEAPGARKPPDFGQDRFLTAVVCGLLLLAVFLVFAQTAGHDFVNIDDDDYVSGNRHVRAGLTADGAAWAFTARRSSHWHPLTWLSLMLDSELYRGTRPAGFHLTNLLLHAASAIVLFLALKQMTRQFWPSALVAGLFAVHPAHVESVAWITERKDVLSGLFGMAAIWAYGWYARRPGSGRYLLVAVLLAAGLMAKPVLVTWPLLFLLLDYWPLQRPLTGWLLLEKVPLLILVVFSAIVTYYAQSSTGDVVSLAAVPLGTRIGRAAMLYVVYLGKTLWPAGLSIYPADALDNSTWGRTAIVFLLLLTGSFIWAARRGRRWLAVGWFWYMLALLPTIGLVQVGLQVMADRVLYLPQIGLCIAIVWSAAGWVRARPARQVSCLVVSFALAALSVTAWRQASYWKDSETLWNRALACAPRNPLAMASLGSALMARGDANAAIARYQAALESDPDLNEAHYFFGLALAGRGQYDAAIAHFRIALKTRPNFAQAHFNLASALSGKGDASGAMAEYREALKITPDYAEAHNNLATLLARGGDIDAAADHFQQALASDPGVAKIHYNFGNALAGAGRLDAAIEQYELALKIQPKHADAEHNLAAIQSQRQGILTRLAAARSAIRLTPNNAVLVNDTAWVLATNPNASIRNGAEAVELAQRSVKLAGRSAAGLDTLAAAYAEAGRFTEAVDTARQAVEAAQVGKNEALAREIQTRLERYLAHTAFRDSR
jgi:tetratricopeptide (TPR) repeat protein